MILEVVSNLTCRLSTLRGTTCIGWHKLPEWLLGISTTNCLFESEQLVHLNKVTLWGETTSDRYIWDDYEECVLSDGWFPGWLAFSSVC